jgi:hypothetical protein
MDKSACQSLIVAAPVPRTTAPRGQGSEPIHIQHMEHQEPPGQRCLFEDIADLPVAGPVNLIVAVAPTVMNPPADILQPAAIGKAIIGRAVARPLGISRSSKWPAL